jgi:hypothetical protein
MVMTIHQQAQKQKQTTPVLTDLAHITTVSSEENKLEGELWKGVSYSIFEYTYYTTTSFAILHTSLSLLTKCTVAA